MILCEILWLFRCRQDVDLCVSIVFGTSRLSLKVTQELGKMIAARRLDLASIAWDFRGVWSAVVWPVLSTDRCCMDCFSEWFIDSRYFPAFQVDPCSLLFRWWIGSITNWLCRFSKRSVLAWIVRSIVHHWSTKVKALLSRHGICRGACDSFCNGDCLEHRNKKGLPNHQRFVFVALWKGFRWFLAIFLFSSSSAWLLLWHWSLLLRSVDVCFLLFGFHCGLNFGCLIFLWPV